MKRLRIISVLVAAVMFLSSSVFIYGQAAQSVAVTFIRAGRLFDSESGAFLPARDIIVKGSFIESVGENLTAPTGARAIDLKGYTVMPGLIDAHTHLLYLENPRGDLSSEGVKALTIEGTTLRARRAALRLPPKR
jgi:imidazolonepropionase-like amidohydrolase